MLGTIKLTRFGSNGDVSTPFAQHNWPLVVQATSTDEMPAEVFVFARRAGALDPDQGDQFENVASAHDIFEIGTTQASNPELEQSTPFYRTSQIRLFLRSPEEVEQVWTAIKEDVVDLVRNLELERSLLAVEQFQVSGVSGQSSLVVTDTATFSEQADQVLLTLDYRPAGLAAVDASNNQTIITANAALTGWLPISEAPGSLVVPAGAKFFYNTAVETAIASELPLLEPGNIHFLTLNGVKLTHGTTFHINSTGIFWLTFDPVTTGGDLFLDDEVLMVEQGQQGNAPWPLDYVDRNSPGATAPEYELLLFRE